MPVLPLMIGMAGGLASAVLFYSAVRGSLGLSIILFLLTPLPLLITGFGWGIVAAVAGALAGTLVMAAAFGMPFGIGYFLALGLPILVVTHLATLVKYGADGTVQSWYPPGHILAAIAVYGGLLPVIVTPMFGGTYQVLEADVLRYLERLAQQAPPDSAWRMQPEQMKRFASMWIDVLPGALASYWTFFFALNTYLAARVSQMSGLLPRPMFRVSRIVLPAVLAIMFAAAIVAIGVAGAPRIIGASFMGSLFVAFLILGFTVAHAYGQTKAGWVTPAAYATAIFANGIALPVIAGVGLGETAFRFRDRLLPTTGPADGGGGGGGGGTHT